MTEFKQPAKGYPPSITWLIRRPHFVPQLSGVVTFGEVESPCVMASRFGSSSPAPPRRAHSCRRSPFGTCRPRSGGKARSSFWNQPCLRCSYCSNLLYKSKVFSGQLFEPIWAGDGVNSDPSVCSNQTACSMASRACMEGLEGFDSETLAVSSSSFWWL